MRVTRAGEVCEISPQLSASARVCTVRLLSALMCPVQRKSALDFSQVLCFHLVFSGFCSWNNPVHHHKECLIKLVNL